MISKIYFLQNFIIVIFYVKPIFLTSSLQNSSEKSKPKEYLSLKGCNTNDLSNNILKKKSRDIAIDVELFLNSSEENFSKDENFMVDINKFKVDKDFNTKKYDIALMKNVFFLSLCFVILFFGLIIMILNLITIKSIFN